MAAQLAALESQRLAGGAGQVGTVTLLVASPDAIAAAGQAAATVLFEAHLVVGREAGGAVDRLELAL